MSQSTVIQVSRLLALVFSVEVLLLGLLMVVA